MRGYELLDKMVLVEPAFLEAAETAGVKKRPSQRRWMALAACLCLVLLGAFFLKPSAPTPPDQVHLPAITLSQLQGNMGFEGILCCDADAINPDNPWSEELGITTLPVYQNGAYDPSGAGVPVGLSLDQMQQQLNEVAALLKLRVLSTEVMTNVTENEGGTATELRAETDRGTLYVQADGGIAFFLPGDGLALPAEYRFTHSNTDDAEAAAVLDYLAQQYRDLLDFAAPAAVSSTDYTFSGELNRSYQLYDAAGSAQEDILNYNLRSVSFFPNDSGALSAIRINDALLLAEKLGDYPVITPDEARELLAQGHYQTSVPTAFPGEEYIGKAELVYRGGRTEETLLPYYRFYVLLPEELQPDAAAEDLAVYGAYYVPAIAGEYITNMPLYDGSFN